ncbi:Fis family transcriptional regulator [Desulfonema ishimotonii]|uniref:Fis family transcriptional regulator n=2 Tax=Desulfonema ishimotonii TaxID=45657 RepID=A0A401FSA3_9BACT|nr:Fis family transcriptional regulator [Desulfonema ishimotonii]
MKENMEEKTRIILDCVADGVFTVNLDWKVTTFNRAAERITGIPAREAIGRHCWEVFKASICEQRCALRQAITTGKPAINQALFIVNAAGERIPVSISAAVLKDGSGEVIGGVETFRDLSVVEQLRKALSARHSFHDIISKNREMQRLFGMMELVAEGDTTVLIGGESGTGKELFARAIHALSPRKNSPMITVNCGALPDTLLESELFGYKAGAFTDARRDKPGRLALAGGGTLFLDEIGDLSPLLQVKLLRVLQEKTYDPLGGVRSEKADVRIVAATNRDLEGLVDQGKFRKDLYYRINVVRLSLPPLRERKEDVPLLADHFIRKFNCLGSREIHGLSPEALSALMACEFPGNVRELENIIEYATVVCREQYIRIEHLPPHLKPAACPAAPSPAQVHDGAMPTLQNVEKDFIFNMLRQNNWNRTRTAARLGIHPSTLWRKIRQLRLEIPKDGRFKA